MRTSSRVRPGSHWFNVPTEETVESTSYGLLATLIMANNTEAKSNGLAVVQWLSEERNRNGGLGSSQVRLWALSVRRCFALPMYQGYSSCAA